MDVAHQLLDAVNRAVKDGLKLYAVARSAGVKPELLYRFVAGERDLRLSSVAKLCDALGLELAPAKKPRAKG